MFTLPWFSTFYCILLSFTTFYSILVYFTVFCYVLVHFPQQRKRKGVLDISSASRALRCPRFGWRACWPPCSLAPVLVGPRARWPPCLLAPVPVGPRARWPPCPLAPVHVGDRARWPPCLLRVWAACCSVWVRINRIALQVWVACCKRKVGEACLLQVWAACCRCVVGVLGQNMGGVHHVAVCGQWLSIVAILSLTRQQRRADECIVAISALTSHLGQKGGDSGHWFPGNQTWTGQNR